MKALLVTLMLLFSQLAEAQEQQFVSRAILTSAIEQREPVDSLSNQIVGIAQANTKLFYFTQLINKRDTQVHHQWYFENELIAEVALNIGSDNWRTYSSKLIKPSQQGEWKVQLVDESGTILASHQFNYSVTQ